MIQTLIAFTIIIMLIVTIAPSVVIIKNEQNTLTTTIKAIMTRTHSVVIIKKEQNVLKQRFKNMHRLHDILIKELNEEVSNNKINKDLNLEYTINYQDELVKVCGSWINIKKI